MSQQGFLDLNEGRAYPFTIDADPGVYQEVVVDLAIRLGDDIAHDLTDEDLHWRLREIALGTNGVSWDFKLWQHDGSGYVAGTEIVVNVGTGAEKFSTHYGHTVDHQSHAYLTVADIGKITAGSTPEAPIEQRTIITVVGTENQSVAVYNAKRRQPYAPNFDSDPNNSPATNYENAKAATDVFIPNVVDEAGTIFSGPVISLSEGYNCQLRGDQAQSLISLLLAVGEGLGRYCEPLEPDLLKFTKQGALRMLNGQLGSNGALVLRNGRNMSIETEPDEHKLKIVVGSPTLSGKCPTGQRDRNVPDPLPPPPGGCQHPDDSSQSSDVSAESSSQSAVASVSSQSNASSASSQSSESSSSTPTATLSSLSTDTTASSESSATSESSLTETFSSESSSSQSEQSTESSSSSSQTETDSSQTEDIQSLSSLSSVSDYSTSSSITDESSSTVGETESTSSSSEISSSSSSTSSSSPSSDSSRTETDSSWSSLSGETGNLLLNPSFEEDFAYWENEKGVDLPDYAFNPPGANVVDTILYIDSNSTESTRTDETTSQSLSSDSDDSVPVPGGGYGEYWPHSGDKAARLAVSALFVNSIYLYQDVDLSEYADAVDQGQVTLDAGMHLMPADAYPAFGTAGAYPTLRMELYDHDVQQSSQSVADASSDSSGSSPTSGTESEDDNPFVVEEVFTEVVQRRWQHFSVAGFRVPAGTRVARIGLRVGLIGSPGVPAQLLVDDFYARIVYDQSSATSQSSTSSESTVKTLSESSQSESSSSETESQSSLIEHEPAPYCDLIQNPSFEAITHHWVNNISVWEDNDAVEPVDGGRVIYPGPFASYGELYQDVDLTGVPAEHLHAIDVGKSYLDFTGWTQARWIQGDDLSSSSSSGSTQSGESDSSYEFSGDVARFRFFFYGSDDSLLGEFDSWWLDGPDSTWVERTYTPDIPPFTRRIRVMLIGKRNQSGSSACDAYFDHLQACLTVKGQSSSTSPTSSSPTSSSPTSDSSLSSVSDVSTASSPTSESSPTTESTESSSSTQSEETSASTPTTESSPTSESSPSSQSDVSTASTDSSESSTSSSSQSDVSTASTPTSESTQSDLSTASSPSSESSTSSSSQSDVSTDSTDSSVSTQSDVSTASTPTSESTQSDVSTASTESSESSTSSSSVSDLSTASTPTSESTQSDLTTESTESTESSESSSSSDTDETTSSSSSSISDLSTASTDTTESSPSTQSDVSTGSTDSSESSSSSSSVSDLSTASTPTTESTQSDLSTASSESSESTVSDVSTASTESSESSTSSSSVSDVSTASTPTSESTVSDVSTASSESSTSSSSVSDVSTASTPTSESTQSDLTTESTESTESTQSDLSTASSESSPTSESSSSSSSPTSESSLSTQSEVTTESTESSESSSSSSSAGADKMVDEGGNFLVDENGNNLVDP